MATMWITEYRDVPLSVAGAVPVPLEPSIAVQSFTFPGTVRSAPLQAETRFVVMYADGGFHYKLGDNTVTAATTDTPVSGAAEKHIGVHRDKGWYIAAVDA